MRSFLNKLFLAIFPLSLNTASGRPNMSSAEAQILEIAKYGILIYQSGVFATLDKPTKGRHFSLEELQKLVTLDGKGNIESWTPEISGWPDTPVEWKNRKDLLWFVDEEGMMNGSKPNSYFPKLFGNILIVKKRYVN